MVRRIANTGPSYGHRSILRPVNAAVPNRNLILVLWHTPPPKPPPLPLPQSSRRLSRSRERDLDLKRYIMNNKKISSIRWNNYDCYKLSLQNMKYDFHNFNDQNRIKQKEIKNSTCARGKEIPVWTRTKTSRLPSTFTFSPTGKFSNKLKNSPPAEFSQNLLESWREFIESVPFFYAISC